MSQSTSTSHSYVFLCLLECHQVASSPGPLKGESPGDELLVVTSSNLSQLKLHYSDLCNHKIRYMHNYLHSNLYVCQSSCVECNVCTIHYSFMQNLDIVRAAQNGSLQDVCDALNEGVHVDTTNEVC